MCAAMRLAGCHCSSIVRKWCCVLVCCMLMTTLTSVHSLSVSKTTTTTTTTTNPIRLSPTTSVVSTSRSTGSAVVRNKNCIVVGGGPVGLASAITLSNAPHYYNVIVLEKSSGTTAVNKFDATRAYLYNINYRGLQWFIDTVPDNDDSSKEPTIPKTKQKALQLLQEYGVMPPFGGVPRIMVVPGDPSVPIPQPVSVQISSSVELRTNLTNFWIPRHDMITILQQCCYEQQQQQHEPKDRLEENENNKIDTKLGSITIFSGKCVETLIANDNNDNNDSSDDILTIQCSDGSTYDASLIVAADGIDSAVRKVLGTRPGVTSRTTGTNNWFHAKYKSFQVRKYYSPASGLILKALQIPSNFTIRNVTSNDDNDDGDIITTEMETMYAIRGIYTGSRNYVSMGLLPMKEHTGTNEQRRFRPGNINTPYNHEIWTKIPQTGPAYKEWFVRAFPRLPLEEWINDTEWDRFATNKGTKFPPCQYSPGSAIWSPDYLSSIVMIGDACHAFPPDIGQGINAGLQDVVALDRSLRGFDITTGQPIKEAARTVGDALADYETNRRREHAALIRLARFGAPYQYRQPWLRHRIGRILWTVNVVVRLLLNKLTAGKFPVAAIQLANQNPDWTFTKVMKHADTATTILRSMVVVPLLLLFFRTSRLSGLFMSFVMSFVTKFIAL